MVKCYKNPQAMDGNFSTVDMNCACFLYRNLV